MIDRIEHFIGQVARPFAIISTSFAAAWATIVISGKVENGNDGAIFAGAYFLGVATLYGAKAIEAINAGRHKRDVDVAHVTGASPTPQPVEVVNRPDEPIPVEPR